MTPDLLRQAGEALYGARWRAPLARDLGVSERTIFYWLQGSIGGKALEDKLSRLLLDRASVITAIEGLIYLERGD